jgi:hypothetical protein
MTHVVTSVVRRVLAMMSRPLMSRGSALCLVLGLIAGYAAAGPSVRAQATAAKLPYIVNVGDTASLRFERGSFSESTYTLTCTVADISDAWVRCAATDPFRGQREQQWYSLKRVVQVTKQEK